MLKYPYLGGGMKSKLFNFVLPQDMTDWLKEYAASERMSMAQVIKNLILAEMRKCKRRERDSKRV